MGSKTVKMLNCIALLFGFVLYINVHAQPIELKVDMNFVPFSDTQNFMDVQVKYNHDMLPASGVLCNLYLSEISREGMMGSGISDAEGKLRFPLVNKFDSAASTLSEYVFITRIANDDRFISRDDTAVFDSQARRQPNIPSQYHKRNRYALLTASLILILVFWLYQRTKKQQSQ